MAQKRCKICGRALTKSNKKDICPVCKREIKKKSKEDDSDSLSKTTMGWLIFVLLFTISSMGFYLYSEKGKLSRLFLTEESSVITISNKKETRNTHLDGESLVTETLYRFYFDDGTQTDVPLETYEAYGIGDTVKVTYYYKDEEVVDTDWEYVSQE